MAAALQSSDLIQRYTSSSTLLNTKYVLTKTFLGKGKFGSVWRGTRLSDSVPVAVKIIPLAKIVHSAKLLANLNFEIKILSQLNHPNVLKLFDWEKSSEYLYMYLEFCGGGDLKNFLEFSGGTLSEFFAKKFIREIAIGYQHLFSRGVIHRDLKMDNIFLTSGLECKIGDFGLARELGHGQEDLASTFCGTPLYMAPEILLRKGSGYTAKVDLWSLGVLLYEMIYGTYPIGALSVEELKSKVEREERILYPPGRVSPDGLDLMKRLLTFDAEKRISFEGFFRHPFVGVGDGSGEAEAENLPGVGVPTPVPVTVENPPTPAPVDSLKPRGSVLCDQSDSEGEEEDDSEEEEGEVEDDSEEEEEEGDGEDVFVDACDETDGSGVVTPYERRVRQIEQEKQAGLSRSMVKKHQDCVVETDVVRDIVADLVSEAARRSSSSFVAEEDEVAHSIPFGRLFDHSRLPSNASDTDAIRKGEGRSKVAFCMYELATMFCAHGKPESMRYSLMLSVEALLLLRAVQVEDLPTFTSPADARPAALISFVTQTREEIEKFIPDLRARVEEIPSESVMLIPPVVIYLYSLQIMREVGFLEYVTKASDVCMILYERASVLFLHLMLNATESSSDRSVLREHIQKIQEQRRSRQ